MGNVTEILRDLQDRIEIDLKCNDLIFFLSHEKFQTDQFLREESRKAIEAVQKIQIHIIKHGL